MTDRFRRADLCTFLTSTCGASSPSVLRVLPTYHDSSIATVHCVADHCSHSWYIHWCNIIIQLAKSCICIFNYSYSSSSSVNLQAETCCLNLSRVLLLWSFVTNTTTSVKLLAGETHLIPQKPESLACQIGHRWIQVGGGQSSHGPHPVCPSGLTMGFGPQPPKDFYHRNGTHPSYPSFCLFCLLSTSLNFRTHNN